MPYMREVCVAGKTIEINKYYTTRHHPKSEKRSPKEHQSCEAQQRVNQRKALKELRRLMNANFVDGDLLVRLDFHKHPVQDSKEMQQCMKKSIRKLRALFKKNNKQLKYIYVKELGPRGSRHIHMVISKCSLDDISEAWCYGGIHVDPLYSDGQYAKIAEYFIKYAAKTEKTEGELIGKRWYASRNLVKPKVTKKVISAKHFKREARDRKGYYIDKDSIRSGISELTGYEYFSYTLIKTDKNGGGG